MGPIQVKDGVLSNNDYIERDKNGIVTGINVIKNKNQTKQVIYYVLWENFIHPVPHSRKSLSRDHSIRDAAKKVIYDKREAKQIAKENFPDEVFSSSDEEEDSTCRDYKPSTIRDYYFEKKQKRLTDEINDAKRAAAELVELDLRLASNKQVDKSEYKSPNLDNVVFATYIQNKHRIISDDSTGPMYVYLD
jgi:hypothetical protein